MLDLSISGLQWRPRSSAFSLDVTLDVRRGQHVAIAGPPGSGKSRLLQLIDGTISPSAGSLRIGDRDAGGIPRRKRPCLRLTSEPPFSPRWSVEHALIAAISRRGMDRIDRYGELEDALLRWELTPLRTRRYDTLSTSERLVARLACVDVLRPAILLMDRALSDAGAGERGVLARRFHSSLRLSGVTVVTEVASVEELSAVDRVVVMDGGRVVQEGLPAEVFAAPVSTAAALSTGFVNRVQATVRGTTVSTPIGEWTILAPPFQGEGVALIRPEAMQIVTGGEESDFLLAIEQARFDSGAWLIDGFITGGGLLTLRTPRSGPMRKGRLLPLRLDTSGIVLVPERVVQRAHAGDQDLPSMADSR